MAAPRLLQNAKVLPPILCRVSRDSSSSASSSLTKHRVLHYLYNRFYDIEAIINWSVRFKQWNVRRKNAHYAYTEREYGKYAAASYYTLSQKGGVRFQGQKDWYRANRRGKFSWNFLEHRELPVECIDLSCSPLTYRGLDNIVALKELRELYLNNCPHLDDWALSRLHVFKDSLEVLSLAGCPSITEKGLATLHHLQNLRYLDVSDLPSVTNKGLIRILMEEVLPKCEIVGIDYSDADQEKSSHTELHH